MSKPSKGSCSLPLPLCACAVTVSRNGNVAQELKDILAEAEGRNADGD